MARLNRKKETILKPKVIKRIRRGSRLTAVNTVLCIGLYILILYPELENKIKILLE